METTGRALDGEYPIQVDRERWLPALPPDVRHPRFPTGDVLRADVFDFAELWRSGGVSSRALTAAVLAWGFGPVGYGVHRTCRILGADPDGALLDAALEGVRAERPAEEDLRNAYVRFRTSSHLKGLGPAFFTKVLYFAGYRRGAGGVQPLILDAVVARNLPAGAGVRSRSSAWPSSEWLSYLVWAARQGGEPELVEIAHFRR